MLDQLKKQREGYVSQLQQVEQSLSQIEAQKERLLAQREQLKGAVFALDSLSHVEAQESAAVSSTEVYAEEA